MTTFDASSAGLASAEGLSGSGPGGQVTPADIQRIQAEHADGEGDRSPAQRAEDDNAELPDGPLGSFSEGDTLALLTQRAAEVQAAGAPEHTVYGFGRQFKIVCKAQVDEHNFRRWQRNALPKAKRRAGASGVSLFDMDQRRLALQCLHSTAMELYVRRRVERNGAEIFERVPTQDPDVGSIFDTRAVKDAFKVIDQDSVINRIFGGSDGPMIRAGNEVMAAAGWADELPGSGDDDDDDEYAELDPRTGR